MAMLLETMTADLRRLAASGQNLQDATSVVSRTFHVLADLVENSQAENTWGKKLLCSSLQVCKLSLALLSSQVLSIKANYFFFFLMADMAGAVSYSFSKLCQ